MISSVRNIASINPGIEVWKYLRLFLNPERTGKRIRDIHKLELGKHEGNVAKQSVQIAHCIRQAEQYFIASADIGLATRPLLLYYGCVALSRALILLKQNGTYSLDVMRKLKKHRHHGLVLHEGKAELASKTKTAQGFFSAIFCSCHVKDSGEPWGHFPLFYQSLDPSAFIEHIEISEGGQQTIFERDIPQQCADALSINQLLDQPFEMLELLKALPDLYRDLRELGIQPSLARGDIRRYRHITSTAPTTSGSVSSGDVEIQKKKTTQVDTSHFFINDLTSDSKKVLLDFLKAVNNNIEVVGDFPFNLHLQLVNKTSSPEQTLLSYRPDVVDDINGAKFFILNPKKYVHESGSILAVMFCLGMLSRYYPDIWMETIEKNVDVVEITTSLLAAVTRKFPNLILDQLSGIKHHIHL